MDLDDRFFRSLAEDQPDGLYVVDTQRSIRYWNKASERITGFESAEVIGKCCADNILQHIAGTGNELCLTACPLAATLKDGKERQAAVYLHHKQGHRLPVHVSVAPLRDEQGEIVGAIESFYDNTPMMMALADMDELKRTSLVCPVTEVANRSYADKMLARQLVDTKKNDIPLAVLFINIDRFKEFNDAFGHQAGDLVLKMVAKSLSNGLRPNDLLGRWGGGEFIAIMPGIKGFELEVTASRLRVLVEYSSRSLSGNRFTVTVSIGAVICRSLDTTVSVVERASKLMFESRRLGENRVSLDTRI